MERLPWRLLVPLVERSWGYCCMYHDVIICTACTDFRFPPDKMWFLNLPFFLTSSWCVMWNLNIGFSDLPFNHSPRWSWPLGLRSLCGVASKSWPQRSMSLCGGLSSCGCLRDLSLINTRETCCEDELFIWRMMVLVADLFYLLF